MRRNGNVAARASCNTNGSGVPLGTKRTPCWASTTPERASRKMLPRAVAIAIGLPAGRRGQKSQATLPQVGLGSSGAAAYSCAHLRVPTDLEAPPRVDGGDAPRQVAEAHPPKSCLAKQLRKTALVREFANALNQVAIGFGRPGGERAEARDDLEGMEVIEPVQHGHVAAGEFEAQK